MDDYPAGSLDHTVPFLAVSGLSTNITKHLLPDPELREQAILVRSEIPQIDTREARTILRFIQEADATSLPWISRDSSKRYRFNIKTIGRVSNHSHGTKDCPV